MKFRPNWPPSTLLFVSPRFVWKASVGALRIRVGGTGGMPVVRLASVMFG